MQALQTLASRFIGILFIPAGIGLLLHVAVSATLAERLLAVALMIFCPELARMASVDLKNIEAIAQQQAQQKAQQPVEDSRLNRFLLVVVSTIVLEIAGFYLALISLPTGAIAVIFSQLWFNLLAGLQLWPGQTPAITAFGIKQRAPVLIANLLGFIFICLWPITGTRIWSASGLLTLIILFLIIKYLLPGSQPSYPDSP